MTKLVVVHPGLYTPTNEALTGSFAPDVNAIRYSKGMMKEDVLSAVEGPVSHIAFLYHYPGYGRLPFFEDSLSVSDISSIHVPSTYMYFSNTLIDIIKALRDRNSGSEQCIVDMLTCDLNAISFKEEVTKIKGDLGIEIRYSVDKTGNPASGANWVLESDGVNVQTVYFTEGVLAWNGVLNSNIAEAIKAGNYSSYITWNAETTTYTVQQNFLWSDLNLSDVYNNDYIALNEGEIFDGNGKTIDITGYNYWYGLFISYGAATSLTTVRNLGILNGVGADSNGFIMRSYTGNFQIQNCYSTGNIGIYGGGIVGSYCGNCSITNCFSTGRIGDNGGGITGAYTGTCNISACYSTGIIASIGGGICGASTPVISSVCNITNCYSTGSHNGVHSGSMIGGRYGPIQGDCTITNCYSLSNVAIEGGDSNPSNSSNPSNFSNFYNSPTSSNFPTSSNSSNSSNSSSNLTTTSCPTDLSTINNTLYSGWLSSVWATGGAITVGGTTYNLPILKAFQQLPWSASAYTIPTSVAQFYTPPTGPTCPIDPTGPIGPATYVYTVLANGTARIISGSGLSGPIKLMYISGSTSNGQLSNIPSDSAYPITEIGASAFLGQTGITGVAAPFVTTVGASAFSCCTALAYLYIGIASGVPTFGDECFTGCAALTSNVFKNINNAMWTTDPSPSGTGLNTYTPLAVTVSASIPRAAALSLTPVLQSGGTASKSISVLETRYNYYVNGTQTQTDILSPVAQAIAPNSDAYYLTADNAFETNAAVNANGMEGTSGSQGIVQVISGAGVLLLDIG